MATSTERVRRFRERQAARLEAVPDAAARDDDDALLPAVETTIRALELGDRDAAIAQLARVLAKAIDDAQDPVMALRVFAPMLFKVLQSMGGSPMARKAMPGRTAPQRSAPNPVAQLRAEHAKRRAKSGRAS